jgi:molecular chaperone Hsp33
MAIMYFETPANSNDLMKNAALPFMLEGADIRGRCVRLNEELQIILNANKYPDCVAAMVGELLILVVMLGSLLKLRGLISIQAQGDGAIGFIAADYTDEGNLRAYANLRDEKALKKIKKNSTPTIPELFGKGFLVITIENNTDQPYQAIVPLEGKNLSECVQGYFIQSDQLESVIKVASDKIGGVWQSGGIILQRIAGEGGKNKKATAKNKEDWNNATILLNTVSDDELANSNLQPSTLLYRLFHEGGVRVLDAQYLKAKCRCSRERMEKALQTISPSEKEEMKVNGVITMTCKFCNRSEIFKD